MRHRREHVAHPLAVAVAQPRLPGHPGGVAGELAQEQELHKKGSSQWPFSSHHPANAASWSALSPSWSVIARSAWSSRLISAGLPAIAETALYGEPSPSWVGTRGSTCHTEQPDAARKSTNR